MNRRTSVHSLVALAAAACLPLAAMAAEEAPDALIKRLSTDVLTTIKADPALKAGDMAKINALVDQVVLPHVNFRRMTSAAVGPKWRQATPAQQERLQAEFKQLLMRTYSGALAQVSDQTVVVKPLRMAAGDTDVLVRTEVRGKGEPVPLDFRLEKKDGAWKVYNFNVLGVWLVETYRTQFAEELNKTGIDGLIQTLASRSAMPAKAANAQ
ncbi:ABC transporter substrate-binding protein [Comamonas terrigena]|nr:ABC transporter substrate-binding protein [Comamonas terrigena]MDH0047954.1 ABC transporter substrate-binding protein [Comamonas terrigena]MDH0510446.1 ABC transporter substrate-binding protein [Comamonas terrigena]MDH1090048.1 ABC transporter substrate-binding protein [Comamonas terrigena]MDH1290181.1 ABC transporter substrate-binding protein [Comamonas terrigena]MDH1499920.1 ABC transporter substrate-binding protein [Comamonas terrigena]